MTNQAITRARLHDPPVVCIENHDIRVVEYPQNGADNTNQSTDTVVMTSFISDDECYERMHQLLHQTAEPNVQLLDQIVSELFVRGLLPEHLLTIQDLDAFHQFMQLVQPPLGDQKLSMIEAMVLSHWFEGTPVSVVAIDGVSQLNQYGAMCCVRSDSLTVSLPENQSNGQCFSADDYTDYQCLYGALNSPCIDYATAHDLIQLTDADRLALSSWVHCIFPNGTMAMHDADIVSAIMAAISSDIQYTDDSGDQWQGIQAIISSKTGDCEDVSHLFFHAVQHVYAGMPNRECPHMRLSAGTMQGGDVGHSLVELTIDGQVYAIDLTLYESEIENEQYTRYTISDYQRVFGYEAYLYYTDSYTSLQVDDERLNGFSTASLNSGNPIQNYGDLESAVLNDERKSIGESDAEGIQLGSQLTTASESSYYDRVGFSNRLNAYDAQVERVSSALMGPVSGDDASIYVNTKDDDLFIRIEHDKMQRAFAYLNALQQQINAYFAAIFSGADMMSKCAADLEGESLPDSVKQRQGIINAFNGISAEINQTLSTLKEMFIDTVEGLNQARYSTAKNKLEKQYIHWGNQCLDALTAGGLTIEKHTLMYQLDRRYFAMLQSNRASMQRGYVDAGSFSGRLDPTSFSSLAPLLSDDAYSEIDSLQIWSLLLANGAINENGDVIKTDVSIANAKSFQGQVLDASLIHEQQTAFIDNYRTLTKAQQHELKQAIEQRLTAAQSHASIHYPLFGVSGSMVEGMSNAHAYNDYLAMAERRSETTVTMNFSTLSSNIDSLNRETRSSKPFYLTTDFSGDGGDSGFQIMNAELMRNMQDYLVRANQVRRLYGTIIQAYTKMVQHVAKSLSSRTLGTSHYLDHQLMAMETNIGLAETQMMQVTVMTKQLVQQVNQLHKSRINLIKVKDPVLRAANVIKTYSGVCSGCLLLSGMPWLQLIGAAGMALSLVGGLMESWRGVVIENELDQKMGAADVAIAEFNRQYQSDTHTNAQATIDTANPLVQSDMALLDDGYHNEQRLVTGYFSEASTQNWNDNAFTYGVDSTKKRMVLNRLEMNDYKNKIRLQQESQRIMMTIIRIKCDQLLTIAAALGGSPKSSVIKIEKIAQAHFKVTSINMDVMTHLLDEYEAQVQHNFLVNRSRYEKRVSAIVSSVATAVFGGSLYAPVLGVGLQQAIEIAKTVGFYYGNDYSEDRLNAYKDNHAALQAIAKDRYIDTQKDGGSYADFMGYSGSEPSISTQLTASLNDAAGVDPLHTGARLSLFPNTRKYALNHDRYNAIRDHMVQVALKEQVTLMAYQSRMSVFMGQVKTIRGDSVVSDVVSNTPIDMVERGVAHYLKELDDVIKMQQMYVQFNNSIYDARKKVERSFYSLITLTAFAGIGFFFGFSLGSIAAMQVLGYMIQGTILGYVRKNKMANHLDDVVESDPSIAGNEPPTTMAIGSSTIEIQNTTETDYLAMDNRSEFLVTNASGEDAVFGTGFQAVNHGEKMRRKIELKQLQVLWKQLLKTRQSYAEIIQHIAASLGAVSGGTGYMSVASNSIGLLNKNYTQNLDAMYSMASDTADRYMEVMEERFETFFQFIKLFFLLGVNPFVNAQGYRNRRSIQSSVSRTMLFAYVAVQRLWEELYRLIVFSVKHNDLQSDRDDYSQKQATKGTQFTSMSQAERTYYAAQVVASIQLVDTKYIKRLKDFYAQLVISLQRIQDKTKQSVIEQFSILSSGSGEYIDQLLPSVESKIIGGKKDAKDAKDAWVEPIQSVCDYLTPSKQSARILDDIGALVGGFFAALGKVLVDSNQFSRMNRATRKSNGVYRTLDAKEALFTGHEQKNFQHIRAAYEDSIKHLNQQLATKNPQLVDIVSALQASKKVLGQLDTMIKYREDTTSTWTKVINACTKIGSISKLNASVDQMIQSMYVSAIFGSDDRVRRDMVQAYMKERGSLDGLVHSVQTVLQRPNSHAILGADMAKKRLHTWLHQPDDTDIDVQLRRFSVNVLVHHSNDLDDLLVYMTPPGKHSPDPSHVIDMLAAAISRNNSDIVARFLHQHGRAAWLLRIAEKDDDDAHALGEILRKVRYVPFYDDRSIWHDPGAFFQSAFLKRPGAASLQDNPWVRRKRTWAKTMDATQLDQRGSDRFRLGSTKQAIASYTPHASHICSIDDLLKEGIDNQKVHRFFRHQSTITASTINDQYLPILCQYFPNEGCREIARRAMNNGPISTDCKDAFASNCHWINLEKTRASHPLSAHEASKNKNDPQGTNTEGFGASDVDNIRRFLTENHSAIISHAIEKNNDRSLQWMVVFRHLYGPIDEMATKELPKTSSKQQLLLRGYSLTILNQLSLHQLDELYKQEQSNHSPHQPLTNLDETVDAIDSALGNPFHPEYQSLPETIYQAKEAIKKLAKENPPLGETSMQYVIPDTVEPKRQSTGGDSADKNGGDSTDHKVSSAIKNSPSGETSPPFIPKYGNIYAVYFKGHPNEYYAAQSDALANEFVSHVLGGRHAMPIQGVLKELESVQHNAVRQSWIETFLSHFRALSSDDQRSGLSRMLPVVSFLMQSDHWSDEAQRSIQAQAIDWLKAFRKVSHAMTHEDIAAVQAFIKTMQSKDPMLTFLTEWFSDSNDLRLDKPSANPSYEALKQALDAEAQNQPFESNSELYRQCSRLRNCPMDTIRSYIERLAKDDSHHAGKQPGNIPVHQHFVARLYKDYTVPDAMRWYVRALSPTGSIDGVFTHWLQTGIDVGKWDTLFMQTLINECKPLINEEKYNNVWPSIRDILLKKRTLSDAHRSHHVVSSKSIRQMIQGLARSSELTAHQLLAGIMFDSAKQPQKYQERLNGHIIDSLGEQESSFKSTLNKRQATQYDIIKKVRHKKPLSNTDEGMYRSYLGGLLDGNQIKMHDQMSNMLTLINEMENIERQEGLNSNKAPIQL